MEPGQTGRQRFRLRRRPASNRCYRRRIPGAARHRLRLFLASFGADIRHDLEEHVKGRPPVGSGREQVVHAVFVPMTAFKPRSRLPFQVIDGDTVVRAIG